MVPLASLHSFKFQQSCLRLAHIIDEDTAKAFFKNQGQAVQYVLGEGSNTAFVDDFDGTIGLVKVKGIHVDPLPEDFRITVGAGENWAEFVAWTLKNGMPGLENLAFIPGTVGAAPIQNIGAYGAEVSQFIESVTLVDGQTGKLEKLNKSDCQFAYRDSVFKQQLAGRSVVLKVTFLIPKMWRANLGYADLVHLRAPTPNAIFEHVVATRKAKLPDVANIGNAGSFFKNPYVSRDKLATLLVAWPAMPFYDVDEATVKLAAAWLIDQLGFKGKARGGIAVHENQALVLTNVGSGTGQHLLAFAREIRDEVHRVFDVLLENEVRLIGKTGLIQL